MVTHLINQTALVFQSRPPPKKKKKERKKERKKDNNMAIQQWEQFISCALVVDIAELYPGWQQQRHISRHGW